MRTNSMFSKAQGFTLVEMGIVLGVAGVLFTGIWSMAGRVRAQSRITDAFNQAQKVKQNILDWRQGEPFSATGNITQSLITLGVIPSEYKNETPTVATSPWNKRFVVRVMGSRSFRMSFYDLPDMESCTKLILQFTACERMHVAGKPAATTTGQTGCPYQMISRSGSVSKTPGDAPGGWQIMGMPTGTYLSYAQYMCAQNVYPPTGSNNSVEADYSF
ncbi:MAG: type II secretion system protein [Alphaproteobacteria bacterium]|nr:type II secretion system protein [Alphaproteobacteria bacterium]